MTASATTSIVANDRFVDRIELQNRLFARLSSQFAAEVPLYGQSLAVNRACNTTACRVLGEVFVGFSVTSEQIERTSAERHGAIRVGTPEEYRWVARLFRVFAMAPHNFYDMTDLGPKSQPIVATAFRSVVNPAHRVFCSLLVAECFDGATRERLEALLASRQVFSERAKALIERSEQEGGLMPEEAEELLREATGRIFKWTGTARDPDLYRRLCDAGFKIAADIACFDTHHLNHLTPNTFCMDLYTAAMRLCLGQATEEAFRARAAAALEALAEQTDLDLLHLLFRHLSEEELQSFGRGRPTGAAIAACVDELLAELRPSVQACRGLRQSGFKDFTEGPPAGTPILLRQDAYKALTEPVLFRGADGGVAELEHTARFGEIEQRFYATTPAGRALYDRCLAAAEAERAKSPDLPRRDLAAYEAMYASHFAAFPKTLGGLLDRGLVHARFRATPSGVEAARRGEIHTTDLRELAAQGHVRCEGLRYEDFLPISAAGIFASNLNQYGTKTAESRPAFTQGKLEEVMGIPIVDAAAVCQGIEAQSVLEAYRELGRLERLAPEKRAELERAVAACPAEALAPQGS